MAAILVLGETIDYLVHEFDFSKINVKDNTRRDYLTVRLAPAYGTLNKESIASMDKSLQVMIAGGMKALAAIPPENRTFDDVVAAMMRSPLMEPDGDAISRSDKLIREGYGFFKFDGSPERARVEEVKPWFVNTIDDTDVINSTQIDIDIMAKIVAWTGATVDSFKTAIFKQESHEKTLVDIGVLRFPDLEHPFFKTYRIKLIAWSSSVRVAMVQKDENGITCEFQSRRFKPRDSVIKQMSGAAIGRAVTEAEALFP